MMQNGDSHGGGEVVTVIVTMTMMTTKTMTKVMVVDHDVTQ